MMCLSPARELAVQFLQPAQLQLALLKPEAHHPHSFVKRMSYFLKDGVEDFFFTCEFLLQKLAPPRDLFFKNAGPR